MALAVGVARESGVEAMVFGDLFLEDVRRYRERALEGTGLRPLFPLWQRPTAEVAGELLELGVVAAVSCVDLSQSPPALAGRWYDHALLSELPPDVDPCGENGEFHTVVSAGPMFAAPIAVKLGEVVERDGFVFADVEASDGDPQKRSVSVS
jgi:diphthamide synthase (EF-2-diphthine--ammonia ligase)